MLRLAMILSLGLLQGCANITAPAFVPYLNKSFFSVWTDADGLKFDFSQVTLGATQVVDLEMPTGERCTCSAALVCGAETDGSYLLRQCSYNGGGLGFLDCNSLLDSVGGSFRREADGTLTICSSSCRSYR